MKDATEAWDCGGERDSEVRGKLAPGSESYPQPSGPRSAYKWALHREGLELKGAW